MTEQTLLRSPTLHVRFDGRSQDIRLADIDIGEAPSDDAVRSAVARHLDVPASKLAPYVVERHENGNLTVRPEAVFG